MTFSITARGIQTLLLGGLVGAFLATFDPNYAILGFAGAFLVVTVYRLVRDHLD